MPSRVLSIRHGFSAIPWTPIGLGLGALAIAATTAPGRAGLALLGLRLAPPRLGLILEAHPAIQLHIVGALVALAIGAALLIGVKGTRLHRTLGWTWVAAMGLTAVSSLFIRQVNGGAFSLVHLLSGWTLIALPMAVYAVRRGRVAAHRRAMTALFVGGLLVAGLLAFAPGRLLWAVFLA